MSASAILCWAWPIMPPAPALAHQTTRSCITGRVSPAGQDLIGAAALPMAVETTFRSLGNLGVIADHTLLIYGAGATVGFAAVQIALMRGTRVIATVGVTFADHLRAFGSNGTAYGDGMVDRVVENAGESPDVVLDTAPVSGVLPNLIKIAGGDPRRVLTITDFGPASQLGTRSSLGEDGTLRYDVLGEFAQLAAAGRFTVPVGRTFGLEG